MKSRRWLQSTEMEYEHEEIMDRQSRISLRPFELFPPDSNSCCKSNELNQLRESDGFVNVESHDYIGENIFPF